MTARLALIAPLACLALALPATAAADFTVNARDDAPDADAGDGTCDTDLGISGAQCTLRAAIAEARDAGGSDRIEIATTGTISLSAPLPEILGRLVIRGPGAPSLVVRRDDSAGEMPVFTVAATATTSIEGLTVANGLQDSGGGIANDGDLTLRGVVVRDNVATASDTGGAIIGGGGIESSGSLTLVRSAVTENSVHVTNEAGGIGAGASGGGIESNGRLVLVESTVARNTALATGEDAALVAADGGGISGRGVVTIRRSTVVMNAASTAGAAGEATGGGISMPRFDDGSLAVEASTVSGNSVAGTDLARGGGVHLGGGDYGASLRSATVAENTASEGANLFTEASPVSFRSTIVAEPAGGGESCNDAGAILTSRGHNLSDGDGCGFDRASDLPATDPLLAPLAANGGATETHAITPESPALDAGVSTGLATDQRGERRRSDFAGIADAPGSDGSDIGAFELQAPPPDARAAAPGVPPNGAPPPAAPPPAAPPAATAPCPEGPSKSVTCTTDGRGRITFTGTDRAETFVGTARGDLIIGGGGRDRVVGRRGGDRIRGGGGRDRLSGQGGADRLGGGGGRDKLKGGGGRDKLKGGGGRDRFSAGGGNDRVNARGKRRERVSCGGGRRDRVTGARGDRVRRSCERVRR